MKTLCGNKNIIELEGTNNTRDLGNYKTKFGNITLSNVFIRSDTTANLTSSDIDKLINKLNITKVIDLRTNDEILAAPSRLVGLNNVKYVNVALPLDVVPNNKITSSIEDIYINILELFKKQFCTIFEELGDSNNCLFHCTGGKDRTGLVSMLLLDLADVKEKSIVRDYLLTEICMKDEFKLLKSKIKHGICSIPLYALDCNKSTIQNTLEYIKKNYGNSNKYLCQCGVQETCLKMIRRKFLLYR